jgi:predicted Zn-dependent peptidase
LYLCSLISYNLHTLDNGLTLIHHEDKNTPMCVTNILYNVGARDEKPDKTGFAHLFEHLMFGGSETFPLLIHHYKKQVVKTMLLQTMTLQIITSQYLRKILILLCG